ncbi:FecR family protein, partial [Steroidobacter sp.]|uniref:FecR family protein n=1 Tax=Steroidobacter sp. TaxID=1978227 RepID=UPI001A55F823
LAWNLQGYGGERYHTAIGQQSTYQLPDGSTMKLNTRSRARVRFSEERRLIELEGEGLFTVAHDSSRPFYVRTSGATVRAVGTKFNVYEVTGETQVAVVEGIVQVTLGSKLSTAAVTQPLSPLPAGSAPSVTTSAVALAAGEAARVIDGRIEKQTLPDPEIAIAWQMHQLVFEDATLSDVVTQFNRYNTGQIYVDKSVGDTKRLSGTFDAIHPQSLLLYLAKDRDLSVNREGNDYRIVREPR